MRTNLKNSKRIVIKIGTTTLTRKNGKLNLQRISKLAWVLTDLKNQGKDIVLVSSGAIAVGTQRLNVKKRPRDTKGKQATSAVGQAVLMQIYQNFFMEYNQIVAQILLTKDVLDDSRRNKNAKNTFSELFAMGVIPIVNENDTISTDELGFSDNDTLSAYVTCLIDSDLLIILSDIDGLYDEDPNKNPNAKKISFVNEFDDELFKIAGESSGELGTGGMITKLTAAQRTCKENIPTIVASGKDPGILFNIINGEDVGTLFKNK